MNNNDAEAENDSIRNVDRRFWPNHVKSLMKPKNQSPTTEMTTAYEHVACEDIIYQHLCEYDDKIAHYQKQFDEMKCQLLTHWTTSLEQTLEQVVNQNDMVSFRMKCDFCITLLTYQYINEILQRQYQQQNPTTYQVIKNMP